MGVQKETKLHYTCDRYTCNESGSGANLPEGWMRVQMFRPTGTIPKQGPNLMEINALLCPACVAWLEVYLPVAVPNR